MEKIEKIDLNKVIDILDARTKTADGLLTGVDVFLSDKINELIDRVNTLQDNMNK